MAASVSQLTRHVPTPGHSRNDSWSPRRRRHGRRIRARRRDQIVVAVFVIVGLLLLTVLGWRLQSSAPPPVATVDRVVQPADARVIRVQFAGDTMLADALDAHLAVNGFDWPFANLGGLPPADVTIVNAEAPITTSTALSNPGKQYAYAAKPEAAAALARAGVDVLGLNNNHVMDMGAPGLADTAQYAAAAGLTTFGAGADLGQAQRPLMLSTPAGVVAVLGFGENYGKASRATDTTPGIVTLSPQTIRLGADMARAAGARWVVGLAHWGDNYADVLESQRYWADQFAASGYDLVIGTGPHVTQPMEVRGGMPVFYSLGNYVFGAPGRFDGFGRPGVGLVVTAEFSAQGRGRIMVDCLRTNNREVAFQPRPCTAAEAQLAFAAVNPALTPVGTSYQWTGQDLLEPDR